jgi:predicted RND superfamily exporter protein
VCTVGDVVQQVSLPIAVVLCFLIAATFMRSVRLAAVTIVPILLTVAWLYGFMDSFDFGINIVTATIGAVSIGIGIDLAIHYTMRDREELAEPGNREAAVQAAGAGTGTALIASAISRAVGFGILAFAPMPLFACYGFLTAVMIVMALVSSLLVLPSLLVLVTRDAEADQPAVDHLRSLEPAIRPSG